MLAPLTATSPRSEPRRRSALERFGRFFAELEETFLEREDVLAQLALALLSREHVLITGPPGTGKSRLAAGVVTVTSRPSRNTANRGQSIATSSTMWVESSTVRSSASSASSR